MHELYGRPGAPDVDPKAHGFTDADLDRTFATDSLFGPPELPLRELVDLLHATYCAHIGTELTHLNGIRQKRWVQERLERHRGRPAFTPEKKREILRWVIAARGLEEFLHTRYPGQKRFSLEGGEGLIPLLDEIIQRAGTRTTREIVVGMAHRGRLNVLVNVLGKLPAVLFEEFEGKVIEEGTGSGDVKYHLGFSSDIETEGGATHVVLAFNPSHLEIINPVVEGSVRARQMRRRDKSRNQVLPVLIHGDAAFAGQGVVTETLNLSETRGYSTGGTIHVIVNNLIGFTNSDPARFAFQQLLHGRGKARAGAHIPRQRERSGGGGVRRWNGPRLPDGVRLRRGHRPRLLPPPRPQRGRRANGHPAADVRKDPQAARSPTVRRAARAHGRHRRR